MAQLLFFKFVSMIVRLITSYSVSVDCPNLIVDWEFKINNRVSGMLLIVTAVVQVAILV